jgi:hypothetical protein
VNAPPRTSIAFDDFKDLEAPLLMDESTAQITSAFSRQSSTFADALYDPVGPYPLKQAAPHPRKSVSVLDYYQVRQRQVLDARSQIRRNYLVTR